VDLARRLGVSKQQLTNVLHGRFGASDMLARGLIEFVKEGGSVRSP
jgi:predicted fused transcriptional regulator/phosphomethylpyrimidine kinase